MTELYIENYKLNITESISALLTFSIDDIKDFSSRSTTWSKTIVLPGTSNNNIAFGHIFQVGIANPYNSSQPNCTFNFNASKFAKCVLFQNQIQSFRGVLRLTQINYTNGFNGRVEYEVSIFGNLTNLNSILTGKYIDQLDFSAYNHQYTVSNITQSWDNPGGSGYYYPLIDYGNYSTDKHNWNFHTFRTSLYAKEYIDKIFSSSGFRYDAPIFNSPRFSKFIIPHSNKTMTTNQTTIFSATDSSSFYGHVPAVGLLSNPTETGSPVRWLSSVGSGFTSQDPPNNTVFKYNGLVTSNVIITFNFKGHYTDSTGFGTLFLELYKNMPVFGGQVGGGFSNVTPYEIGVGSSINISLNPGDTITWRISQSFYDAITDVWVDSASFSVKAASGSIAVPIQIGDTVTVNDQIPKNIRQIDFLVGIVKLHNLYIYEDKNDPFLIHIVPYNEFYSHNLSNAVNWTNKLDRSKAIKSKPMSEINAKIYQFKFKSDSDYYNDLYRKRYNEGYGDRVFDSQFEFSQNISAFEIVFSATPLVGYGGEDKIYSTILKRTGSDNDVKEENTDSNIRILQSKKKTGVNLWNIVDDSNNVISTLNTYGYAGHLDDPDAPNNDLNFGATKELFFILTNGNLSANQFNLYWSNYMADITDKDSRLVVGYFKLNETDILNLDFSKYIHVDGIAFKLNKIKDYNITKPDVCEVELLKVISASYSEAPAPEGPPNGCFLLWDDNQTLDADNSDPFVYGDCSNPGDGGGGTPPPPTYSLNWSWSKGSNPFNLSAFFDIKVDGVSLVHAVAANSGNFNVTDGQVVEIKITGFVGRQKRIFISNDVDGLIYDDTVTNATNSHTIVIVTGKNYTVNASIF